MSSDSGHHKNNSRRSLVRLTRRRMGQEGNLKSPVTEPCPGEICGNIGGKIPGARLAAAPNCARQDLADQLITEAKTSDKVKSDKLREQLIQWAKLICESEQNTHPNYQANPQTQRNFLYCLKVPKNKELEDCIPKQFEGNDPKVFYDHNVGDVALGSRPETFPRQKQNLYKGPKSNTTSTETGSGKKDASKMKVVDAKDLPKKCNKPEIKYGKGFPGRPPAEMTYMPAATKDEYYSHGAALNMNIIANALCDQIRACLKEEKKEDDKIFTSCKALSEAIGNPVKNDGKAADTWNAGVSFSTF
ncbi:hypothetical protein DFH28DRAFT_1129779 [Melampsora americana]|nr:hypothetical protein DFH28DRAFT_1129779 [Melampsora americana]